MKRPVFFFVTLLGLLSMGCQRSSGQTWEDVKTAGRYLHKGINTLVGKDYDSYLYASEEDLNVPMDEEFIPLMDSDLTTQFTATDTAIPQPKSTPGEKSSGIPGMERFQKPSSKLASIFRNLHFETDDHVIRERDDLVTISKIANYLKKNPSAYVIVEGHCDERASAAYNMALGTRRANHIRVLLVKQGANPNHVYTVSRGKEQPVALGHSSQDWHLNRRAEFKVYEK